MQCSLSSMIVPKTKLIAVYKRVRRRRKAAPDEGSIHFVETIEECDGTVIVQRGGRTLVFINENHTGHELVRGDGRPHPPRVDQLEKGRKIFAPSCLELVHTDTIRAGCPLAFEFIKYLHYFTAPEGGQIIMYSVGNHRSGGMLVVIRVWASEVFGV